MDNLLFVVKDYCNLMGIDFLSMTHGELSELIESEEFIEFKMKSVFGITSF